MFIRKIPKPVFIIVGVVVGLAIIGKLARSNNPELLLTKGQEHFNSGEYNKALRFCHKVTRKKPDQIEPWNCKAESALFAGKTEEARDAYNKILEFDSENIEAILGIGDTFIESGEFVKAYEQYGKLFKDDSEEEQEKALNLINEKGKFAPIRQAFWESSLEKFEELTETKIYSDLPVVWWGRGITLIGENSNNSTSAIVSFDKAFEISDGKFYPALLSKGQVLIEEKDHKQGLSACEQALEINPDYIDAKLCQVQALFGLGRYDRALASTENILQANPEDYGTWILKGVILVKIKKYDLALEACKKAISINPNDPLGYSNQADVLYYQKNYDQALNSVNKAIQISQENNIPISNDTWFIRGNVLTALGQYRDAVESYYQAVQIREDFVPAWNEFARVLEKVGNYDDAVKAYQKAIEFDPKYYYAWEGLANVYSKQGKYSQAVEAYDQVIKIVEESEENLITRYPLHGVWNSKGKALLALGEYGEAIDSFTQALEIKPDFASASFNLGKTLMELNLYENAITAFDQAIENDPDWQTAKNERTKAEKLLDNAPFLGISMRNTDDGEGVLVITVYPNSPAERQGIKVNDIITEIDGLAISSIAQVQFQIRSGKIGSWMKIEVKRNGSTKYFDVKREKRS